MSRELETAHLPGHPGRPGRLRERERRPEPDPPGRAGGPLRRAPGRHRARHVHDGAGRPRGRELGRSRPGRGARLQVHQARRGARGRRGRRGQRSPARWASPPTASPRSRWWSPAATRRCSACPRPSSVPDARGSRTPAPPRRPDHAPARRPRRPLRRGDLRGRAGRHRQRRRRRRRTTCSSSPAAATSWSPTTASPDSWSDRHPRRQPGRRDGRRPDLRRRTRHRRRGGVVGRPGRPRGRLRLGRHRGLSGIPGSVGRHPDPERRCLRPGGRRDRSPRSAPGTASTGRSARSPAADCGFGYRHSRFKADPEPLRRPLGDLPAAHAARWAPR